MAQGAETVAAKQGIKPKIMGNVPLMVGRDSPQVVDADGRYDQPVATRKGEQYVKTSADELATSAGFDADGSTTSPITGVGTAPVSIPISSGAKYIVLRADAALRWGDNTTLDGTSTDGYSYLSAYEASHKIPVTGGATFAVRINAASGTTTVWFWFGE